MKESIMVTHDTGNLNKEIEIIKKEKMGVLELKSTVIKKDKNPLDEINSRYKINRYKMAEERISELENRAAEDRLINRNNPKKKIRKIIEEKWVVSEIPVGQYPTCQHMYDESLTKRGKKGVENIFEQ